MRKEIEALRAIILSAHASLEESIKWNGPNYHINGEDRITMKIHPPKVIQIIFHRGAKTKEQPKAKLIIDTAGLLDWKTNDRAVATFRNESELNDQKSVLIKIVNHWLVASK
jgi:hypothetical protein